MAKYKITAVIIHLLTFIIAVYRMITDHSDVIIHWGPSNRMRDYGPYWTIIFLPIISVLIFFLLLKGRPINHSVTVDSKKKGVPVRLPLFAFVFLYITFCAAGYVNLHPLILLFLVLLCTGVAIFDTNRK